MLSNKKLEVLVILSILLVQLGLSLIPAEASPRSKKAEWAASYPQRTKSKAASSNRPLAFAPIYFIAEPSSATQTPNSTSSPALLPSFTPTPNTPIVIVTSTPTPTNMLTYTPTATFLSTLTASAPAPSATPIPTNTPLPTPPISPPTATPTATATPTPTTPLPTPTPTLAAWPQLFISEVAWAGTQASANDEWVELYNPNDVPITLDGWQLVAADGRPTIALRGTIPARGFFLLERTDDTTVADVPADLLYTGSLSNTGETLYLLAPDGQRIDAANHDGGPWPAGDAERRASMARFAFITPEADDQWATSGPGTAHDALGNPILGSPKASNPPPTPTPRADTTPIPPPLPAAQTVRLSEFLPHPRYDWNGDGRVDRGDEFIEIINLGPEGVDLSGWYLDDGPGGSKPYRLPETGLNPYGRKAFFASETRIRLNDRYDQVRLLDPYGRVVDVFTYVDASSWNLSWCRLAELRGDWAYPCWPTPNARNQAYGPPRAAYLSDTWWAQYQAVSSPSQASEALPSSQALWRWFLDILRGHAMPWYY